MNLGIWFTSRQINPSGHYRSSTLLQDNCPKFHESVCLAEFSEN